MTLQQLRYVTAVAGTGTISHAVQQFYISQPSLTNAIRELEQEVGLALSKTESSVVSQTLLEYLRSTRQQKDAPQIWWIPIRSSDVVVYDSINARVAIFEAKYTKTLGNLESECETALQQIDDRMYAKEYEDDYDQILCYGISFFKKRCMVKKK